MADVIEAIVGKLLDNGDLLALLNSTDPVGYMTVLQGTEPPYVLVSDVTNRIDYQFLGNDSFRFIDIEAIAPLTSANASGYTIAKNILNAVFAALQDIDLGLTNEEGATICVRRKNRIPGRLITVSGNEQYLRRGDEWEVVVTQ